MFRLVPGPTLKGTSMPYSAEISRLHPTCLLFLIDQSASMEDPFGGDAGPDGAGAGSKAQSVADAINRLLSSLVIRATKAEGVRHYFDVGVIGYGSKVGPAFDGPLAGRSLVSVEDVYANPARVEERTRKVPDGAGGLVEEQFKLPIWFDPISVNGTPMCAALRLAASILEPWVLDHAASYRHQSHRWRIDRRRSDPAGGGAAPAGHRRRQCPRAELPPLVQEGAEVAVPRQRGQPGRYVRAAAVRHV
jgi:hypothetical protein